MKEKWSIEEAVVLIEYYFVSHGDYKDNELNNIRSMLIRRAEALNIEYDDKFRNLSGLHMQLGCIDYIVSNGKIGLKNVAKIFYEAYELYLKNKSKYYFILSEFYNLYGHKSN